MKKNKIACIYNLNNNMFVIARFLRSEGYDADLLLMDEPEHFLPKSDSFDDTYLSYTYQLNWMRDDFWKKGTSIATKDSIKNDLKKYDVIIACGYAPSFVAFANLKTHIFIPYGSDFYHIPFVEFDYNKYGTIANQYPRFQNKAIEEAKHIVFDYTTEQEPVFKKFKLKGKRHYFFPPVFYNKEFNDKEIKKNYHKSELFLTIKKLREENDYLIIQHCRQSWKNPEDIFSNKRNDILIYAYKKFIDTHPSKKAKLILLEYGVDVEATKELIKELNLTSHVFWLPKSPRKELMVVLSFVDIGIAELGLSFLMYGTVGEFMTMNVPFILNCEVETFKNAYPELYPVNHANSVESCFFHLNNYLNNSQYYKNNAQISQNWFNKYIIDEPLKKLGTIIETELKMNWLKKIFN